jgi:hypothetical protein
LGHAELHCGRALLFDLGFQAPRVLMRVRLEDQNTSGAGADTESPAINFESRGDKFERQLLGLNPSSTDIA